MILYFNLDQHGEYTTGKQPLLVLVLAFVLNRNIVNGPNNPSAGTDICSSESSQPQPTSRVYYYYYY